MSEIQFARAEYFEVSAKLGVGVEDMFKRAAEILYKKIMDENLENTPVILYQNKHEIE